MEIISIIIPIIGVIGAMIIGAMISQLFKKRTAYNKMLETINLMKRTSDIVFFTEKEKELRFLQKAFWENYSGSVPSFDYLLDEYKKKLGSLLEIHFAEFEEAIKEGRYISEENIKKIELVLEKAKHQRDTFLYCYCKEHFPKLKKKALMRIAERSMKDLHEDIASVIKDSDIEWKISKTLDKINAAEKARNDAQHLKEKVKKVKIYLRENRKKIKKMQKENGKIAKEK